MGQSPRRADLDLRARKRLNMAHEARVLLAALQLAGLGPKRARISGLDLSAEIRVLEAIARYQHTTIVVPSEIATVVVEQLSKKGITISYGDSTTITETA